MLKKLTQISATLLGAAFVQPSVAQIRLSEVDSSTLQVAPSTEAFQFVELRNSASAEVSLDGFTLVFVNGASNRVYRTVSLDGWRIPANGFFVVGNPGVPNVDLVLPLVSTTVSGPQTSEVGDAMQPGPDAVVLVRNSAIGSLFDPELFLDRTVPGNFLPAGRSVNTASPSDPFGNGVIPVSSLVYQTSAAMAPDTDLLTALAASLESGTQVGEGERVPGDFANRLHDSIANVGGAWVSASPTPGAENLAGAGTDRLFVNLTGAPTLSVDEGAAPGVVSGTVELRNAAGVPKSFTPGSKVSLTLTDCSEVTFPGGAATMEVTVPAGPVTTALSISLVVRNDDWKDGDQVAFIQASTTGGIAPHACWLTVKDINGTPPVPPPVDPVPALVITEINGHPAYEGESGQFKTGASGQFVEIVNQSSSVQNLSGFRLFTNAGLAHVFNPCTRLQPGQAIVVFKGGVPAASTGLTSEFGTAIAVNSVTANGISDWKLAVKGVDCVRLISTTGGEVAGAVFHALQGGSSSDLNAGNDTGTGGLGMDPLLGHRWQRVASPATLPGGFTIQSPLADQLPSAADLAQTSPLGVAKYLGNSAPLSSPGTKSDGTNWTTVTDTITLTTVASVSELKGPNAGSLRLSLSGPVRPVDTCVLLSMVQNTIEGRLRAMSIATPAGGTVAAVDASVLSLTPNPNAQYYEVIIPALTSFTDVVFVSRPCGGPPLNNNAVKDGIEEVYTFTATSSVSVNTLTSTPASVRVREGSATVTLASPIVFEGQGTVAAGLAVTLTAPTPSALTFDIYTADFDSATSGNAVFDPALPCLADPATAGSTADNPGMGVPRIPANGVSPVGTVTIPAAGTSGTTSITIPSDAAFSGNRFVRFTAIARVTPAATPEGTPLLPIGTGIAGFGHLKVIQSIVLNEISTRSDVDANGDGTANAGDAFVEIVNNTNAIVDLAGKTLTINGAVVHTFPFCSELPPFGSVVVFAGGAFDDGIRSLAAAGSLGTSLAQKASSGGLAGLVNGAMVALMDGVTTLNDHTFELFPGGSNVRRDAVDRDGSGLFAKAGHNEATVYGPSVASAGRKGAGTVFATAAGPLTVSLDRSTVPELWALPFVSNRGLLTISRPAADPAPLKVCLISSNPGAARPILPGTPAASASNGPALTGLIEVTIPAGQASVTFPIVPVDTTAGNGDLATAFRITGGGYINSASTTLTARDSGTLPVRFRSDNGSAQTVRTIVESAGANAAGIEIAGGPASSEITTIISPAGPVTTSHASLTLSGGAGVQSLSVANSVPVEAPRTQSVVLFSDAAGSSANSLLTVNTIDDGGIENGPFINEIDYEHSGLNFVEVTVPGGAASPAGLAVVVYNAAGQVVSATDLTEPVGSFLAIGSTASIGSGAGRQNVPGFTLPPSGAVAVYRRAASTFVVGSAITADVPAGSPDAADALIDAVVFGGANPTLQNTLTPGTAGAGASGLPVTPVPAFVVENAARVACDSASRVPDANVATLPRLAAGFASAVRTPGQSNAVFAASPNPVFDSWLARFGLSGAAADLNADPDGDGIPNGMEFFLGNSPTAINAVVPVMPVDGAVTIPPASAEAACEPGLVRQRSSDLTAWTSIPAAGDVLSPAPPVLFIRVRAIP